MEKAHEDVTEEEKLRPVQAASLLGISTQTLTLYAEKGLIPSYRLPSGHRRYLKSDVLALRKAS